MTNVLITPKSYYEIRDRMRPLLRGLSVEFNDTGRTLTEAEMAARIKDVEGLLIGVDPLTRPVLEQAGRLRAVSKYGVGIDNIDTAALAERGVPLKTAPGTNAVSVAELTLGLLFTLGRDLFTAARTVKEGGWQRRPGVELTGKTLGLVGCGGIGREVALRARGLRMAVQVFDPYLQAEAFFSQNGVAPVALDELLASSDFVSLHLPLTAETRALIDARRLAQMKPGAYLINTARGELVDEAALLAALKAGTLAGAACDVFSREPPGDHPLLALDNFILTPHIGANTREAVLRMARLATENLITLLRAAGGER